MPSEKNLQLLLTVPVLLAALCAAAPAPGPPADQGETSGTEMQDTSGERKFCKLQETAIADLLWRSIISLRDEQFKRDFGEPVKNMTNYEHVRIPMLLIKSEDRCRQKNFGAPRCLKQIHAGLRIYKEHLGYLEKENLTTAHLPDVKHWTSSLIQLIRNKMDLQVEDTDVQPSSSSSPQEESAWKQKIFTHSILYNYSTFLIDANRAMKHMCDKGFNYVNTDNKGRKLPLEKHQHY